MFVFVGASIYTYIFYYYYYSNTTVYGNKPIFQDHTIKVVSREFIISSHFSKNEKRRRCHVDLLLSSWRFSVDKKNIETLKSNYIFHKSGHNHFAHCISIIKQLEHLLERKKITACADVRGVLDKSLDLIRLERWKQAAPEPQIVDL